MDRDRFHHHLALLLEGRLQEADQRELAEHIQDHEEEALELWLDKHVRCK